MEARGQDAKPSRPSRPRSRAIPVRRAALQPGQRPSPQRTCQGVAAALRGSAAAEPGGVSGELRVRDGAGAARPLPGGARAASRAAMKAFPDQPGFAHALARLLAAAPDDRVRDGARAPVDHERADEDTADARDGRDDGDGAGRAGPIRRGRCSGSSEAIARRTKSERDDLVPEACLRICGCIRAGSPAACRGPTTIRCISRR